MHPVETGQVPTAAGPVAIRSLGPPGAPALLWAHGYTLDASLWEPLWRLLPGRRHVGLDLPGHGASRAIVAGDRLGSFADALLAVADAAGARDLVGLSFGGTICLRAAAQAPRRFDRMVLCAPTLPGGPEDQDAADCNQMLLRLHTERGVGPWLAERWLASPPDIFTGARAHPELIARIAAIVARHRWGELAAPVFMPDDTGLAERLGRVTSALLLLLGADDMPSFGRTAAVIARRLRRASVRYIPDAGHLALLERPDAAACLIDGFLGGAID